MFQEFARRSVIGAAVALLTFPVFGTMAEAKEKVRAKIVEDWDKSENPMENMGKLYLTEGQNFKIHTYHSAQPAWAGATHIIETPKHLYLVDTQFLTPYAAKAKEIATGISKKSKKSIKTIFISHEHPDHWFGNSFWQETDIASFPKTKEFIDAHGKKMHADRVKEMGEMIPPNFQPVKRSIEPGTQDLDGVEVVFQEVTMAEGPEHLVLWFPQDKIVIAQDLIYNGLHHWVAGSDIGNWIKSLEDMKKKMGKDIDQYLVYAGHGAPGPAAQLINSSIDYLKVTDEFVKEVKADKKLSKKKKGEVLKEKLLAKFPKMASPDVIDYYIPFLFGNGH